MTHRLMIVNNNHVLRGQTCVKLLPNNCFLPLLCAMQTTDGKSDGVTATKLRKTDRIVTRRSSRTSSSSIAGASRRSSRNSRSCRTTGSTRRASTSSGVGDDPSSSSVGGKPVEMKAKLERSRQSARECRARKKLRYQYLEELVSHREKAVLQLREELEQYREWCRAVDDGRVPDELRKALAEPTEECEEYTNDV